MVLETETLDTLKNIEYLLELLISQDGRYKEKLDQDGKATLKAKVFK